MGAPLIEWKEHRFMEDDDSETDDGDETDDDEGVPAVGSSQMSAATSVHQQKSEKQQSDMNVTIIRNALMRNNACMDVE